MPRTLKTMSNFVPKGVGRRCLGCVDGAFVPFPKCTGIHRLVLCGRATLSVFCVARFENISISDPPLNFHGTVGIFRGIELGRWVIPLKPRLRRLCFARPNENNGHDYAGQDNNCSSSRTVMHRVSDNLFEQFFHTDAGRN